MRAFHAVKLRFSANRKHKTDNRLYLRCRYGRHSDKKNKKGVKYSDFVSLLREEQGTQILQRVGNNTWPESARANIKKREQKTIYAYQYDARKALVGMTNSECDR